MIKLITTFEWLQNSLWFDITQLLGSLHESSPFSEE